MTEKQLEIACRRQSCVTGLFLLLLVAVAVFVGLAVYSFPRYGSVGIVAAAVSVGLCFVTGFASLVAIALTAGGPNAVSGLFLGVFLRTLMPLIVAAILLQLAPSLAKAGLLGMLVVAFLVLLLADTYLSVRVVQRVDGLRRAASAVIR